MYVIVKKYVNWHRENCDWTGKTQEILKHNLSGYPVMTGLWILKHLIESDRCIYVDCRGPQLESN